MQRFHHLLFLAVGVGCGSAPVAAERPKPTVGVAAASPAATVPRKRSCEGVDRWREASRSLYGDALLLKYDVSFPEHERLAAQLVARRRVVRADAFAVFPSTVRGREVVLYGVVSSDLAVLRQRVRVGTWKAWSDGEAPPVAVGLSATTALSARIGDVIDFALEQSEGISARVVVTVEAPADLVEGDHLIAYLPLTAITSATGGDPTGIRLWFSPGTDTTGTIAAIQREVGVAYRVMGFDELNHGAIAHFDKQCAVDT